MLRSGSYEHVCQHLFFGHLLALLLLRVWNYFLCEARRIPDVGTEVRQCVLSSHITPLPARFM
jgi:hypothetical protein